MDKLVYYSLLGTFNKVNQGDRWNTKKTLGSSLETLRKKI